MAWREPALEETGEEDRELGTSSTDDGEEEEEGEMGVEEERRLLRLIFSTWASLHGQDSSSKSSSRLYEERSSFLFLETGMEGRVREGGEEGPLARV